MGRLLWFLALVAVLAACGETASYDQREAAESAATTALATKPVGSAAQQAVGRLPIAEVAPNFAQRAWDVSPDGESVAFIGDGLHLYIAERPGFEPRKLADGPASEPRWSPDGRVIAYSAVDQGLRAVTPDGGRAVELSPDDDLWRTRIVRVLRWVDDTTLAYEAHCGTGCQHLFEMTIERGDEGLPAGAGEPVQVPFVLSCDGCVVAGLAFHYSPDGRYIAADYGGTPSVAWYDRSTGEQWLVRFDDDGPDVMREFHAWHDAGPAFRYREAPLPANGADISETVWHCWRVDPEHRTREPAPCGGL
jgi:hypothetical protein